MRAITVGLIGNPNSGKTTLFNHLTGSRQTVGNWPGVTVERKAGSFKYHHTQIDVVDLPGIYSLTSLSHNGAIDEQIACHFILSAQADIIVNVIDAANLERNLYLTTQLLAMQVPLIIALNMMDTAKQQRITIDTQRLAQRLGCPVIALTSTKGIGITELKACIANYQKPDTLPADPIPYPEIIKTHIETLTALLVQTASAHALNPHYLALSLLETDQYAQQQVGTDITTQAATLSQQIKAATDDPDILIADARYGFIHQLAQEVLNKDTQHQRSITARLDQIILHRILGIPIFLGVMYLMFAFAINIGGAFQDFFDITTDTLFIQGVSQWLNSLAAPQWLTAIIANGIGKGINTTATFIPIIGAMFLFLSFLEGSGYMARAAFVMDRLMRAMGLPGKSFVPLIVGFGCNVPAIMATRTLESERDRILTIMMSPFMSCGARLTIFAVFAAAFFAQGSANIVFSLYLTGIIIALLTGLILRKTILRGTPEPFVMELPLYHLPTFKTLYIQTWSRLKSFILNAGKIIIPICIIIGVLNSLTLTGHLITDDVHEYSILATIGQWLTPIFAPLGLTSDNWPATVALLTGTLAKEVVVATLNTLYSQMGHIHAVPDSDTGFSVLTNLSHAVMTIPTNLQAIPQAFSNPILATIKDQNLSSSALGIMHQHFNGKASAYAYLLFILLYIPCVSTTAVIARELNKNWALFSVVWSAGLAYSVATLFYQLATVQEHPYTALSWIISILLSLVIICIAMRIYAQKYLFKTSFQEGAI